MNRKRIQLLLAGTAACISLMCFIAPTQGASIVIGGNTTDIGTIIIVSPKAGDTPVTAGTALLNTLDAIEDNSATNPYLIKVGPGIYDIGVTSLQMKEYVDIEGSGEKTTKITGAVINSGFPPTNGTVNGASHAELRFLTVENTGVGLVTVALLNSSASPSIVHVTANASRGTNSYGVFNTYSSPVMTNVTASASGETVNYGVYNTLSSSPVMTNVTASGSGGTIGWGVASSGSGTVKINHSVINGTTNTIWNGSGVTTLVANTQLDGGVVFNNGTLTCVGVYDENFVALGTDCQAP
jgi:hypothetical protein